MQLMIFFMILFSILALCFPTGLIPRKNIYGYVMNMEEEKVQGDFENKTIQGFIKAVRRVIKFVPKGVIRKKEEAMMDHIIRAGLKKSVTAEELIASKYMLAVVSAVFFLVITIGQWTSFNLTIVLLAGVMAYFIPDQWIVSKGRNRQNQIKKDLPSVLSTLAVITDAGLNLIPAIEETSRQHEGMFSRELRTTLEDIYIGVPQKEAFIKLSRRCDVEEVNYFVSALVQGLEKGNGGITKIIRDQAKESWEKRKHNAKELAEKASLKLFMPLLLLVFPAFIIFLIVPMAFSVMKMF